MVTATSNGPLDPDDVDKLLEAVREYVPSAHFQETTFGQELSITITRNEDGTYTAWTYGS